MNTNMTGLKMVLKILCVFLRYTKVASALEGLMTYPETLRRVSNLGLNMIKFRLLIDA